MDPENLKQVYEDPDGPRGPCRQSLTDNQKTVLWSMYATQTYGEEPTEWFKCMRSKARLRAVAGLVRKGLLTEDRSLTPKGVSYATRLRRV
jgi:hypothetical protein